MAEPDLTAIAMDILGEMLHSEICDLAGKPLAFVLIVADGKSFAVRANMPMTIASPLLTMAAEEARNRAEAECDTPQPAAG